MHVSGRDVHSIAVTSAPWSAIAACTAQTLRGHHHPIALISDAATALLAAPVDSSFDNKWRPYSYWPPAPRRIVAAVRCTCMLMMTPTADAGRP